MTWWNDYPVNKICAECKKCGVSSFALTSPQSNILFPTPIVAGCQPILKLVNGQSFSSIMKCKNNSKDQDFISIISTQYSLQIGVYCNIQEFHFSTFRITRDHERMIILQSFYSSTTKLAQKDQFLCNALSFNKCVDYTSLCIATALGNL